MLPYPTPTTDSATEDDFSQIRLDQLQSELSSTKSLQPWQWAAIGAGCFFSPVLLIVLLMSAPFCVPLCGVGIGYSLIGKKAKNARRQDIIRESLYEFSQISLSTSRHCDTALTILRALPLNLRDENDWMSKKEIKRVLRTVAEGQGQIRLSETHRRWLWDRVLSWRFPAIRLTNPVGIDTTLKFYFSAFASCGNRKEYMKALLELDFYFKRNSDPEIESEYREVMASWLFRLDAEETQATLLRAGIAPDAHLLRPVTSSPEEESITLLRSVGDE